MTTGDKIRDKDYNMILTESKVSVLPSGKIDKYEYLTGEQVLPFDQNRRTEQTNSTYLLLGKALLTIKEERKLKL